MSSIEIYMEALNVECTLDIVVILLGWSSGVCLEVPRKQFTASSEFDDTISDGSVERSLEAASRKSCASGSFLLTVANSCFQRFVPLVRS
jgi:hypothetical protein